MSDDNRFAPPDAAVADPATVPLLAERPQQVRVAVALLWLSFALGIPSWILGAVRDPGSNLNPVVLVITALLFCFVAFVNVMIHQGKNWARIVTLVFVAISVLTMLLPGGDDHPPSGLERVIIGVDLLVELVAIVLLFTRPGLLWFRRRESA